MNAQGIKMIYYKINIKLKEQYYENNNNRLERFDGFAWNQERREPEYFINEFSYFNKKSEFISEAYLTNINSSKDIL